MTTCGECQDYEKCQVSIYESIKDRFVCLARRRELEALAEVERLWKLLDRMQDPLRVYVRAWETDISPSHFAIVEAKCVLSDYDAQEKGGGRKK